MSHQMSAVLTVTETAAMLHLTTTTLAIWRAEDRGPRWYRADDYDDGVLYLREDVRRWFSVQVEDGERIISRRTRHTAPYGLSRLREPQEPGGHFLAAITQEPALWLYEAGDFHLIPLDVRGIPAGDASDAACESLLKQALRNHYGHRRDVPAELIDWVIGEGADELAVTLGVAGRGALIYMGENAVEPVVVDGPGIGAIPSSSWRTFPLKEGTRIPARKGWRTFAEGHGGARNYGIECEHSKLVVIDLDERPDGSGRQSFLDLQARYGGSGEELPTTFTVRTPRNGLHLYFAAPSEVVIKNSAGVLAHHVDVRGMGGYVPGRGTTTEKGMYAIELDTPVAPLPAWFPRAIQDATTPPESALRILRSVLAQVARLESRQREDHAFGVLERCVQDVLDAVEGARNDTLNRAVFTAAMAGAPPEEIREVMATAADVIGLPAQEAHGVIERAIAAGLAAQEAAR